MARAFRCAALVTALLLGGLYTGCAGEGDASMVDIPGGAAWVGCETALEAACETHEMPRHAVTLTPFAIDRLEVTADAYVEFLNSHGNSCDGDGCADGTFNDSPVELNDGLWTARDGLGDHPMTKVSWYGAAAFCEAEQKRLCTEVEWEVAALGTCADGSCETAKPLYPWGDEAPSCALAHMFVGGDGCDIGATAPVGSLEAGASVYGVLDMAGNAWEWVADEWHDDYTDAPADGLAWTGGASGLRVVRGGGLSSGPDRLRGSHRWNAGADGFVAAYGFRCCR